MHNESRSSPQLRRRALEAKEIDAAGFEAQ
jgi:hypothetical protein